MTAASDSHPESFVCRVRDAGAGVVCLLPTGDLDAATVDRVVAAVRDAQAHPLSVLVLDLRALSFMDSAGLHLILDTDAWARQTGVRLTIVPGPRAVRRLFEVTGTGDALQLVDQPPDGADGDGRDGRAAEATGDEAA